MKILYDKSMKKLTILWIVILFAFLAGCGKVQNTTEGEPFTFEGIVYQTDVENIATKTSTNAITQAVIATKSILADAGVRVLKTGDTTITNKQGTFGFIEVPRGEFAIEVSKEGYLPLTVTVGADAINIKVETSALYWPQNDKWFKTYKQLGQSLATANLRVKIQQVRNRDYIELTKTKADKSRKLMWFVYNSSRQELRLVKSSKEYTGQEIVPIFENETNYVYKKKKADEGVVFITYPITERQMITADIYVKEEKVGKGTTIVEKYIPEFTLNNIKYKNVVRFKTRNDFANGNYQESVYWLAPKIGIIKIDEQPIKWSLELN